MSDCGLCRRVQDAIPDAREVGRDAIDAVTLDAAEVRFDQAACGDGRIFLRDTN